jgi:hypothetical protein
MAKRRKRNGQFTKGGGGGGTTRIVRAAAPIIRVSAPRAATKKHRRKGGARRSSSFLGGVAGRVGSRTAIVMGSAALGYASKEKWLEKLPVIGKAGPITSFGLLGWGVEEFLKVKLPPIVHDMITSALALSAFNIGFSGGQTLVGEDAYHLPGGAVFFD